MRVNNKLSSMKQKTITSMMLALAILVAGCGRQQSAESVKNVKTDTVRAAANSTVLEFPARVKAAKEVNLAFKVSGTLQRYYYEEGAFVKKGTVVAQMDERDYRLQLEAAEAEYNSVKAEVDRIVALRKDSVVAENAYDKARYGLQQIKAKYENCKNQLADTKIAAPFDGYIQKRLFDAPAIVAAGMPVLTVISDGTPEVEINIPGSEYIRREEFGAFEASFDFWPGRRIPLRLISISPKANANQLYTVRLALTACGNPKPAPGMNTVVSVKFRTSESNRMSVPASALFAKEDKSYVWVCSDENTVSAREVKVVNLHTDGSAILSAGVEEGERIVTSGVHTLREGDKVAPMAGVSQTNVGGLL